MSWRRSSPKAGPRGANTRSAALAVLAAAPVSAPAASKPLVAGACDRVRSPWARPSGLDPREYERLLLHVLGVPRVALYRDGVHLTPAQSDTLSRLIGRRLAGEPLQYLLGTQPFRNLLIRVRPGVLIPRPETEGLVDVAVRLLAFRRNDPLRVVDLGTGSGCIALAIAAEFAKADVVAVERSTEALAVAAENFARHPAGRRVRLIRGDLAEALERRKGTVDLVVSNPPYIPTGDLDRLPPEVRHEPREALDGGPDGLAVIRRVVAACDRLLRRDGWGLIEIGRGQKTVMLKIARTAGFTAEVLPDLAGIPRVAVLKRRAESIA